jgi:hypothetical protein
LRCAPFAAAAPDAPTLDDAVAAEVLRPAIGPHLRDAQVELGIHAIRAFAG